MEESDEVTTYRKMVHDQLGIECNGPLKNTSSSLETVLSQEIGD